MAEYKGIKGFKVQSLASDPTLVEGQVWYNTTGSALKYQAQVGAWASGGALNAARSNITGMGTQTAAITGGGTPPSSYPAIGTTSETYNGTAWTEVNDINTARSNMGSDGIGTQ